MVEIKEGLEPTPPTSTVAQITYQRFFPRYLHLGGMSGTLLEARHELRVLYDAPVVRLPLAQADRRRWIGEDLWVDAERKWLAVLDAVRSQRVGGRPVLVGTDSVGDAERISALLHSAGIAHQVLSATQDADEAGRVARAGVAGMVTVATNMAGRGTDIRLDAAAAACGGLHVVAAMRNRARRIDRQLIGRAARHGDPGSAQSIVALDDALLSRAWPAWLLKLAASAADNAGKVPASVAGPLLAGAQRLAEWRDQGHRRALRGADRQMTELYGFAGGTE
jgi:preprotein translocase subunit SecA